jgi:Cu+-exporting ATPase
MSLLKEYRFPAVVGLLLLLNVTGVFPSAFGLDTALIVTALAGYKTFYNSISALMEKKISADVALCVAVIAALATGEYLAAAEAMFIVMVGEVLESFAAGRTEAAIHRFIAQMPRRARLLKDDGSEHEVNASMLVAGDRILVRAGERIAADGVVDQGFSSIDESSLTGEPLPHDKQPGDEVFSGSLNGDGLLRIRVTRAGSETTLARVVKLVEEAREKQAPVERLADRYARYFLPALLLSGALTYLITGNWLRTVAVLIVACPCALILATPTAMVAAIGGLARRGILVRGGAVLQQVARADTAVFDKTGTVTEGRFEVAKIVANGRGPNEVLTLAAAAERASTHALARVIVEEAQRRRLAIPDSEDARVLPGRGAEATLNGRTIRAGSAAFLADLVTAGIRDEADRLGATAVFVADGDELAGAILLRDRVREGASALSRLGVSRLVMLTGDRREPAQAIASEVGIDEIESDLLPEEKLARVRDLAAQGHTVAMFGDGINDAPALAAAHVGIAVSGASDITAEAADVVYMPQSLDRLPQLFDVSRRAMQTAWLNIVLFAGAVNALAVLACATGKLGPIGAACTHQLSSFLVMMNSLRLLRLPGARWARPRLNWRRAIKPALATAAAGMVLAGFYTVQPGELGVIERFGRKVTPFSQPGAHYKLPWPIERLTKIPARRVRVVEIGSRSGAEWNTPHTATRVLMLTGDQNMIELSAAVHYSVEQPDTFLFRQLDGDVAVREAAESVIQSIATTTSLNDILTTGRLRLEAQATIELQRRLDRYETGVRVLRVKLEDVHPSTEVVDAFREVAAAFEEKNRVINEAEGYRNEQVALARGTAQATQQTAQAYSTARTNRAAGDASRFTQQEQAFRTAPGPTETRLYLETMEQVLPGRKKLIIDSTKARRHLFLLEDGVEILGAK